jgi:hypothetical protein
LLGRKNELSEEVCANFSIKKSVLIKRFSCLSRKLHKHSQWKKTIKSLLGIIEQLVFILKVSQLWAHDLT